MSTPVSRLEASYRRVLAAYPGHWRREQGEEFIGVLLEVARSEHRSLPTAAELLNIIGNGLSTRAVRLLGRVSRPRRNGIAFAATALATYLAVTMTLLGEWGPWVGPGQLRWRPTGAGFADATLPLGPFATAAAAVYLMLIAAFCAALLQRRALRRTLLLSAAAVGPLISLAGTWTGVLAPPLVPMLLLSALALLSLAGTPARTRASTLLLAAVTGGLTLGGLALAVRQLPGGSALFFYNPDTVAPVDAHTLTLAAAALMLTAGVLLLSPKSLLPWTATAAAAAAPLLGQLWIGTLLSERFGWMTLSSAAYSRSEWLLLLLVIPVVTLAASAARPARQPRVRSA